MNALQGPVSLALLLSASLQVGISAQTQQAYPSNFSEGIAEADQVAEAVEWLESNFDDQVAEWIHITDFDAMFGNDRNVDLVGTIIRKVGIPVQVSGGFRTEERIRRYLDMGAGRIVMGTVATRYPGWVRTMSPSSFSLYLTPPPAAGNHWSCELSMSPP